MMPGCQICCTTELCTEGRRLRDAFDALCTDWQRCQQGTIRRWHLYAAEAAYLEHLHGSWEAESAPLSKDERASLRAFVNRRRPDIPARRAGMHQR